MSVASTELGPRRYTVRTGDNMTHIAKRLGVETRDLIAANDHIADPNQIRPGQELNVPPNPHRRQPGQPPPAGRNGALSNASLRTAFESVNGHLLRGSRGPAVAQLQTRLRDLGHNPGPADGIFGRRTHDALRDFQRSQSLRPDGVLGPRTKEALLNPEQTVRASTPATSDRAAGAPRLRRYEPGSPEARALFREAADLAGVPRSWADSRGLHNILRSESDGYVGIPNYTYGSRKTNPSRWPEVHNELRRGVIRARSSASGLGQLLLNNVDRYYPNGRAGIGDPVQEAAGMLAYIKDRYGSPERAWSHYNTRHEGY